MTILDKAITLLENGVVEIDGDLFRLRKYPDNCIGNKCKECDVYSICGIEHATICAECEIVSRKRCGLQLADT